MNGFLIVDKPKGITSMTVCNKIKYSLNLNKSGHNGTLDPNATGVMVVGVNKGTKLMKLINEHDKEYIATIIFGYDSDTLDMEGNITADFPMSFTKIELENAILKLKDTKTQIPPMTSAIKVNGKKLYEYQRKGIEVEVKERSITIYESELASDIRYAENHIEVDIRLFVSKGFYVRSYARDLGKLLGGAAVLKELRRTKAGDYTLANAIELANICENDIIPIEKFFDFPKVEVNDYIAGLVKNGVTLDERQTKLNGVFYVTNKCDIIAIYESVSENKHKPILIF